ncbi:hypothetical protein WJX77_003110 [Trebouxia sp. C0004]
MQLQLQLHGYDHRLYTWSRCKALRKRISTPNGAARSSECTPTCSIKARWCIDIKYGVKMEAIGLLQEWVQNIGSQAGLTANNTTILSGAVGAPESRLEAEVELGNLAELEAFWGQVPSQAHKAWSQRAQHYLIDGSPQWEVYRNVSMPAMPEKGSALSRPAREPSQQTESGLILPDSAHSLEVLVADTAPDQAEDSASLDDNVILDWKGDPMQINPGDKLPFGFK